MPDPSFLCGMREGNSAGLQRFITIRETVFPVHPEVVKAIRTQWYEKKGKGLKARKRDQMRIYVGNMPYAMTEEELRNVFEAYGTVTGASLALDRETRRPRGFGFVEMPETAEANAAVAALNGSEQGGRRLVVNEARPREERPRGPRTFGGGRDRAAFGDRSFRA